ncbi:MAG TPA: bifunctional 2-polyprenyl-6-hydroxyphenol methylase/3-demethylubiquinol 3-O-methyltransferase UbiG [Chlamydiales bacterium]|nr:bifunctional 2-polyprenyl-6-hydroxyphenol methylase/3-demethylubiquinol 3-O-methyltransferase UbiG [Chlamydiales bacterium]
MAESISLINNEFYDHLNSLWYEGGEDHPISLLRAENRVRTPWVANSIDEKLGPSKQVLDIGCGAGLLSNFLSLVGHQVTGIDLSFTSLRYAKERDVSKSVRYLQANANKLPFENACFDVVCAMDLLEHVDTPARVISEAARVLKPGGMFFFHTFNRNLLSYLMIIKAVEWFIPRTPKNMHVYNLFIKPEELQKYALDVGFEKPQFVGLRPAFLSRGTWRMVLKQRVESDFLFKFVESLKTGYCGYTFKK